MKNLTNSTFFRLALSLTLSLCVVLLSSVASAKLLVYSDLMTKNYDEMRAIVTKKVNKAKELSLKGQKVSEEDEDEEDSEALEENEFDKEAIEELRTAIKIIMARPNPDNMITKLIATPRKELKAFNAYEDSLSSLTDEAVRALKRNKMGAKYLATYLIMLENLMSELRPMIPRKPETIKVFEKIAKSEIEVSSKIKSELRVRSMLKSFDPVETAKKVVRAEKKKD